MRYFIFLFLFGMLIFQSCEDKKSAAENAVENKNPETENHKTAPEAKKKAPKKVSILDTIDGQLLTQKDVIPFLTQYGKENPETKVRISTKFGNIDVKLYEDTPLHRANFILLAKEDYFKDTYFHRVVHDFIIQGGNSDNPSTNKKRYKLGDYLLPNEYKAHHPHVRGSVSAAKFLEQNVSDASSPFEFFIVQRHKGAPHLNAEHTVFGEVIAGMDVVDSIAKQPIDDGEWPLRNVKLDVEVLD